jgi:hypothetical protein
MTKLAITPSAWSAPAVASRTAMYASHLGRVGMGLVFGLFRRFFLMFPWAIV